MRYTSEAIPISNHGFDPCTLIIAQKLVKGFEALSKSMGIDTNHGSFYLEGDLLLSLVSELRNNVDFDGFRITFGLTQTDPKKIIIALTRVRGLVTNQGEKYFHVPQQYFIYDSKKKVYEMVEYAIIPVINKDGSTVGRFIDINSSEYKKMISDFRKTFCKDAGLIGLINFKDVQLGSELIHFPPYLFVYSYFIGKGILRILKEKEKGIKLFFGYGSSTPYLSNENMHLIAISTDDKNATLDKLKHNTAIWATYDSLPLSIRYIHKNVQQPSGDTHVVDENPGFVIPLDGSSTCIRPEPPYKPASE